MDTYKMNIGAWKRSMGSRGGWIGVSESALATNPIELAWAAGFFDGEGSTFLNRNKVRHYERPGEPTYIVNTIAMSVCQVDRRPLDRFVAAIGAGKVRGPYKPRNPNSNAYYRVEIEGRVRVCAILTKMWPFLSAVKCEQARRVWQLAADNSGPKSPPLPPLPIEVVSVDLDATLATYDGWHGPYHVGTPIPAMVERVKKWLAAGIKVKIFTARASDGDRAVILAIENWCEKHLGQVLEVTNQKDYLMIQLWDDRAVQVIPNTGMRADGEPEECCYDGLCVDCNPKPCDHDALEGGAPIQCPECGAVVQ